MAKKNSGKAPAYQMYPKDWNEDTELKMCSYAAEGLWIRLTNTSYEMLVKGVFVKRVNHSKDMVLLNQKDNQQVNLLPLKLSEIAKLLRGETEEKTELLNELLSNNVLKKFEDGEYKGAFYVKRIYIDMKLRAIRQEAGKQGGNPDLLNQKSETKVKQNSTPSSSSSISLDSNINITISEAFGGWWKIYPRKVGKPAAERKFKSIKPTGPDYEKIMATTKVLAEQAAAGKFRGDTGLLKFCPYPATWLNQGRYMDEPEPQTDGGQPVNELTHPATEAEIAALEAEGLV